MKSRSIIFIICTIIVTVSTLQSQSFKYIGASKCKQCHNKPETGQQYKIWSESLHAKALKSLSSEPALVYAKAHNIADPTKDPGCLKCHSTAGNVAKGIQSGIKITEGVSCESCHGPGSAYKAKSIMKDRATSIKNGMVLPTRQVCEQCHNNYNPFFKPFDFDRSIKKIAHPNPAMHQN
jgi:hypothetical protein